MDRITRAETTREQELACTLAASITEIGLQDRLLRLGLDTKGTKIQLAERLANWHYDRNEKRKFS